MPVIHVRSLPFKQEVDFRAFVEGLCQDFAEGARVGVEDVSATWEVLPAGRYAQGGQTLDRQPEASHPILVDLLAPGSNSDEAVERMLVTVAASISARTGVPQTNIFITYREARSGRVYDGGSIVRW